MKEIHKLTKPLIYFTIIIFTSSCGDEDIAVPCLPLSLTSFGEDIRYQYDDQGKLASISYYSQGGSFAKRKIVVSYINGRLSGAIDKAIDPDGTEILINKYDLEYTGDKPGKLLVGLNQDSRTTTEFSYDSKGRLVLLTKGFGSMITKTRYEYNDKDNVVKIFYTSPGTTVEVLGAENTSFDDKARFYAGSKELGILNVFVFGYEPSKNNKLQSTISWNNPGEQNTSPRTETYTLEYNDDGLITALSTTAFTSVFTFLKLKYTCD
jgi:hypothetical protein